MRFAAPFVLIVLLLLTHACAAKVRPTECSKPTVTIITRVNIVDVETGVIRRDRILTLSGGKIFAETDMSGLGAIAAQVGPAETIDAGGAFAIPGLWDMHVHALWHEAVPQFFFERFLAAGVTSIRDMGGDLAVAKTARRTLAACPAAGPNLWFPGPFLDGPQPVDPALSVAIATEDQARSAVRSLAAEGVDFIKVYSLLAPDLLEVVLDEARRHGKRVSGHVPAATGASGAALRLASIEHLAIEAGGYCAPEDRARCATVFEALRANGVAQSPTLFVRERTTAMAREDFPAPGDLDHYPAIVQQYWQDQRSLAIAKADARWFAQRAVSIAHSRWMLATLNDLGAVILAGSDAGNPFVAPGSGLHDELEMMVAAGMSPRQALQSATLAPARFMGVTDRGGIAAGMRADFVLLERDPLAAISNLRKVVAVYKDGVRVFSTGEAP